MGITRNVNVDADSLHAHTHTHLARGDAATPPKRLTEQEKGKSKKGGGKREGNVKVLMVKPHDTVKKQSLFQLSKLLPTTVPEKPRKNVCKQSFFSD